MAELTRSNVGRKIFMAVSGWMLLLFVSAHLLGNMTVYSGWINEYAEHLHAIPLLLWAYRVFMLIVISVHVFFGIQLTLENTHAKPSAYVVEKSLSATFAGKTMIWSGAVIGIFLLIHLLHFTLQVIFPEHAAVRNVDAGGRPDVLNMVIYSFRHAPVSLAYGIAILALYFHLTHGIESSFQSLGLQTEKTQKMIIRLGAIAAAVVACGYLSLPVSIFLGVVR
jgi:succinate dehydrogenase / fumarate reductase cytochrome b subunit